MTTQRPDDPPKEQEDLPVSEGDRRKAIEDTAGVLTGVYSPGYLEQLRADWPD